MKTDLGCNKKTEFNQHMLKCLSETVQKFLHKCYFKKKSMQQIIQTVFAGPYYTWKGYKNSTRIEKIQK